MHRLLFSAAVIVGVIWGYALTTLPAYGYYAPPSVYAYYPPAYGYYPPPPANGDYGDYPPRMADNHPPPACVCEPLGSAQR